MTDVPEAPFVAAMWRYPVKFMQGEELSAAQVTMAGLVGADPTSSSPPGPMFEGSPRTTGWSTRSRSVTACGCGCSCSPAGAGIWSHSRYRVLPSCRVSAEISECLIETFGSLGVSTRILEERPAFVWAGVAAAVRE